MKCAECIYMNTVWLLNFPKIKAFNNQTGSKMGNRSIFPESRNTWLHLKMTLSRARTPARAFAPGDHLIQNIVILSRPRIFVSTTEDVCLFFFLRRQISHWHCICFLSSFEEEGASFHLWLPVLWHHCCFPWMHYSQSRPQTRSDQSLKVSLYMESLISQTSHISQGFFPHNVVTFLSFVIL